jgi:hypothetical protein
MNWNLLLPPEMDIRSKTKQECFNICLEIENTICAEKFPVHHIKSNCHIIRDNWQNDPKGALLFLYSETGQSQLCQKLVNLCDAKRWFKIEQRIFNEIAECKDCCHYCRHDSMRDLQNIRDCWEAISAYNQDLDTPGTLTLEESITILNWYYSENAHAMLVPFLIEVIRDPRKQIRNWNNIKVRRQRLRLGEPIFTPIPYNPQAQIP